ncbi:MAG: molecular chaperone DnaK [Bradymonadales bacterium]
MGRIIGIDLGTTNSCVSTIENGEPNIIVNAEGMRTTPSMVAFNARGERNVGQQAKRQAAINPDRTVSGVKRLIGSRYSDNIVQELKASFSCEIVPNKNGDAWLKVGQEVLSPQEISALIIEKLKTSAEAYLGEKVDEVVIAVPAYFNDAQRQATRDSATLAGLKVRRIMNEPTLAALSFGYRNKGHGHIIVFDLGGGTFDVSVLELREGTFKVKATAGNNHLGGNDFDDVLFHYICDKFKEESGVDVRLDKMAVQRVREAAETLKCELSTMRESSVNLPFLAMGASGPIHLSLPMTREELEELVIDLVKQLEAPCLDALEQSELKREDITDVLLVGGMTRMPIIYNKVREIFQKKPARSVNPDEAVALGAAVQSGILGGDIQELILLDVTPLNLGVRVAGNRVSTIIERNTSIPTRASKIFTTTEDNQEFVTITITQGDSPVASEYATLGQFILSGIPRAPAGKARIEVQFCIDSDGIVSIQGVDRQSGATESITIQNAAGLSSDELSSIKNRLSL